MNRIDQSKFEEGIRLTLENAERLLNDARLLYEKARYSSSRVLAMLSWEEAAKAWFILERKQEGEDIKESEWRGKARQHVSKLDGVQNTMGMYGEPIFECEMWEEALIAEGLPEDHSTELKNARENLTYVDYDFVNNVWVSPDSVFIHFHHDQGDCFEAIGIAEICIAWIKEQM